MGSRDILALFISLWIACWGPFESNLPNDKQGFWTASIWTIRQLFKFSAQNNNLKPLYTAKRWEYQRKVCELVNNYHWKNNIAALSNIVERPSSLFAETVDSHHRLYFLILNESCWNLGIDLNAYAKVVLERG